MHRLKLKISKFKEGLWSYHIIVPQDVVDQLTKDGNKRIMCSINSYSAFHAGLMPDGEGGWFVMLNKDKMKEYRLVLGQEVEVVLEKDESKYGMYIPEVFEELLYQDPEGEQYFESLTPGKKRSLIHMVASVKSDDIKLRKALVILHHLKVNKGKLDYKALNEAMKSKNQDFDFLR